MSIENDNASVSLKGQIRSDTEVFLLKKDKYGAEVVKVRRAVRVI